MWGRGKYMPGLKIGFFQGMRAKDIFRYSLLAALFIYLSANLSAQSDNGTEFGIADDLTVLGVQGTAIDPDVELKGFTVFGATQAAYTGAIIGPGNVVVNGALAVSSGAYFADNSTFTAAGKIFITDGSAGQLLQKSGLGNLVWISSSSITDNTRVAKAGDTMTGALVLPADPTAALQAATKQYVDTFIKNPASPAQGDLLYHNGTSWVKLSAGTLGQILKSGGTGANPYWGYQVVPPTVGGEWLFVPGDSSLGTNDFYVMKYEARSSGGATSTPSGTPWVSITQTAAKTACEALGAGYHLLRMEEAQTISRNIENIGWNWTGGSVESGGLWRGHSDNAPAAALAADITGDPDDDPYVGTGNTSPSIEKRVHQLSTTKYIWDWSGNVWEWVDMTCTGGTGAGLWQTTGWLEWSDASLSDYEKGKAGPAGAYTSVQNAGQYYGCTVNGNAVLRGGRWADGASDGVFAFHANAAPSASHTSIGFRCGR